MKGEAKFGCFEVSIGEPHPCWITIAADNVKMRIDHRDLADLEAALQWLKRQAELRLPGHVDEIRLGR